MTENEQAISSRLPLLPPAALPSPFQPRNPEPVVHPAQLPCAALDNVHLTLENKELWTRFYLLGNEMIITRPGRRMFPVMRVKVTGMEPTSYYMMLMTFVARDHYRYRFLSNCWLPVETATDPPAGESNMYLHESGPCLGAKWMLAPVDFGAVKLTNQKSNSSQKVMLQSMRKYVPYIHVFAGSDVQQLDFRRFKTFMFPETEFISVTSYQNDQIIALKIQNNPYARSFCSNTDRRNAIRRLTDEELGSGDDTAAALTEPSQRHPHLTYFVEVRRWQSVREIRSVYAVCRVTVVCSLGVVCNAVRDDFGVGAGNSVARGANRIPLANPIRCHDSV
ncbi:hypothetical protein MRX96_018477 [Rhipicephalus microplus]